MKPKKLRTGGRILLIPPDAIVENPLRARIYYNDAKAEELVRSVAAHGLVEPITVCAGSGGRYVIVSGERRYRAAKALRLPYVPCVLIRADAESALVISLSNHLTQDALSCFETAMCYEKLKNCFGLPYEEIASVLGTDLSEIVRKVRLLGIPPALRRRMLENGLGEAYAKLLVRHPDAQKEALLDAVIRDRLTLGEAKALSEKLLCESALPDTAEKGSLRAYYKDITVFQNTIERAYNAMRAAGINAELQQNETDAAAEYLIRIPKPDTGRRVRTPPDQQAPASAS